MAFTWFQEYQKFDFGLLENLKLKFFPPAPATIENKFQVPPFYIDVTGLDVLIFDICPRMNLT